MTITTPKIKSKNLATKLHVKNTFTKIIPWQKFIIQKTLLVGGWWGRWAGEGWIVFSKQAATTVPHVKKIQKLIILSGI